MQKNEITLGATKYERFKEYPDRTVYNADDHTIANPHVLTLSRVELKSSDASVKSRFKFAKRINNALGTKSGDLLITVESSFPQWVDDTAVIAELAQAGLFLASDEAEELILKQSI